MRSYRFSELAELDLIDIALYGDENFGVEQSDKYRERLKQRFLMLAEQPMVFRGDYPTYYGLTE